MGIIVFDLRGHGGCLMPKTPSEAKKGMKELIYQKEYLIKVSQ
jgi:hypothetical protein